MSPSHNFFALFKSNKSRTSSNSSQGSTGRESVFSALFSFNEHDRSSFFSYSSSDRRGSNGSSSTGKSSISSNNKEENSKYFIQTWYDPAPNITAENTRTTPLSLVSYLPPIWVDEETEEINDTPETSIADEDEEEEQPVLEPPTIIITPSEDDDEVDASRINRLAKQDRSKLCVPGSLRRSRMTHYIPYTPKSCSATTKSVVPSKLSTGRKVRFEIGARLDPNEDCLLNFSHSVHSKRQHQHSKSHKRCFHVRFIVGSKGEEAPPFIKKDSIKQQLRSCLKVRTNIESLIIAHQNEAAPKNILRKPRCRFGSCAKKVDHSLSYYKNRKAKVTFNDDVRSCAVDRHIEWQNDVEDARSLRKLLRERRLEKRRTVILTRPIEEWIDEKERDEGMPREGEDDEEEYEEFVQKPKTEQDLINNKIQIYQISDQQPQLATLRSILHRKKHLLSLMEHLDFSNAITHKVRFEQIEQKRKMMDDHHMK